MALRITGIFYCCKAGLAVGLPTVFVRLTGCPLRCTWCGDLQFHRWRAATIASVLAEVAKYPARQVCHRRRALSPEGVPALSSWHCAMRLRRVAGNLGALDVSAVDPRVSRIMDLKAPDSGEVGRNLWSNLDCLDGRDEIKIVIASRGDYEWARDVVRQRQIDAICPVLISPAQGLLEARSLADWILKMA